MVFQYIFVKIAKYESFLKCNNYYIVNIINKNLTIVSFVNLISNQQQLEISI
ncbi:hypothetical protein Cycma_3694 [Cyclobacterium marinum DSM 745]|uniref:Uncharacterized protein n=1 Tax=Cyclobacterium marinum (strain ATCC 25205 / DSM 745 / LMG 13164 / NCIMB 1802) TaxID=880070 RepID=G0J1L1_CYCMS|nr:hypothetical protein Cycma_3694 [Cyclobacterium marinum DSM 745]